MPNLTAWKCPQNLREHADAFWAHYNPNGKSLEETNIELNEQSLNGVLLSTLLDRKIDLETFERRAGAIVEMTQGYFTVTKARYLLKRAIGFKGGLHTLLRTLRQGPYCNPHYEERSRSIESVLNDNLTETKKSILRKHALSAKDVDDEKILSSIRSKDCLSRTQVIGAVRALSFHWTFSAQGGVPSDSLKSRARRLVADTLGYKRWHDLFRVCIVLNYIPNLQLVSRDDLEDLLARGAEIETISDCRPVRLEHFQRQTTTLTTKQVDLWLSKKQSV